MSVYIKRGENVQFLLLIPSLDCRDLPLISFVTLRKSLLVSGPSFLLKPRWDLLMLGIHLLPEVWTSNGSLPCLFFPLRGTEIQWSNLCSRMHWRDRGNRFCPQAMWKRLGETKKNYNTNCMKHQNVLNGQWPEWTVSSAQKDRQRGAITWPCLESRAWVGLEGWWVCTREERPGPRCTYGGTYKSWNKSQNPPPLGFSSALVDCCVKYGSPNLSSEKVWEGRFQSFIFRFSLFKRGNLTFPW